MSAAEDVAEHIHGSLLDLRRRLDVDVAIEVSRAVMRGAVWALRDLCGESGADPAMAPDGSEAPDLQRPDGQAH